MQGRLGSLRAVIREALESSVEDEIDELTSQPELRSLDDFAMAKLADDAYEYNFIELQALARLEARRRTGNEAANVPSQQDVDRVRKYLEGEVGMRYVARQPLKHVRGVTSPAHGTHPFAGSGGGGTGFGNTGFEGGGFTSFGGGPGAVGGGYKWDPNDPKNLSMGTRRRR